MACIFLIFSMFSKIFLVSYNSRLLFFRSFTFMRLLLSSVKIIKAMKTHLSPFKKSLLPKIVQSVNQNRHSKIELTNSSMQKVSSCSIKVFLFFWFFFLSIITIYNWKQKINKKHTTVPQYQCYVMLGGN